MYIHCLTLCCFIGVCSRLQQEYQTLFHHSFRVSDYITAGEGSKMKALVEVCAGLKVSS